MEFLEIPKKLLTDNLSYSFNEFEARFTPSNYVYLNKKVSDGSLS